MRDKNIFYIVIGLAIVLVLSVGYALFSESLSIKGTARAEARWDIDVECYPYVYPNLNQNTNAWVGRTLGNILSEWPEEGYENPSANPLEEGLGCQYSVNLKYPGAGKYFSAKITNNGDIDAYMDAHYITGNYSDLPDTAKFCWDQNHDGTLSDPNECGTTYKNGSEIGNEGEISSNTYSVILDENENEIDASDDSVTANYMYVVGEDDVYIKLPPRTSLVIIGRIFLFNDQRYYTDTNSMNIKIDYSKAYRFTQVPEKKA